MTTVAALSIITEDIPKVLEKAGLINGDVLSANVLKSVDAKDVMFFDTASKSIDESERVSYLIWSVLSVEDKDHADDNQSKICTTALDFFTKSKNSTSTFALLKQIEAKFKAAGYRFEYEGPTAYNRNTARYLISFTVTKTII